MALEKYEMKLQENIRYPYILHGNTAPASTDIPQKVGDIYLQGGTPYIATYVGESGWDRIPTVTPNGEIYWTWNMRGTQFYMQDEFMDYTNAHRWTTRSSTGTLGVDGSLGNGGWLKLASGAGDTNYAGFTSTAATFSTRPTTCTYSELRLKLNKTENFRFCFGVTDSTTGFDAAAKNSVYMELGTDNTDPTYWYMCKNTAGTVVKVKTLIEHIPTTTHTLSLGQEGNYAWCYIDSTYGLSEAFTGLPDIKNASLGCMLTNVGGVASTDAFIDAICITGDRV